MKKLVLLSFFGLMSVCSVYAQRVTDKIDRGIVAVPNGSGNFVSWRMFGEEYYDTKYNLYRGDTKIASNLTVTNFNDASGNSSSVYSVEPVVKGVAQARSSAVKAWSNAYLDVKLKPVVNRAGTTIGNSTTDGGSTTSGYTINDVSLADVTGDGVAEFIVKRNNSQGNLREASNNTDFNLYECYKTDGTRLWWIDLGPNLMAGPDEQWDMIGYDWDQDGKAEMIMRGSDNMIIHTATGKNINIGSMTVGMSVDRPEYMGIGNEYLLYINGETGEPYGWDGSDNWTPMAYPLPQFETGEAKNASVWGDLGHRMMKHYFGAPYLDGRNPSIFLGRGAYTRHKFCALDVNPTTHELTQRWRWNCYDSNSPWYGNGFHNFQIADVDMDGRDEIMFGSMCIDDTGFGLSTTGLGHGDAQHCGDLDPYRWGLEQFTCQEGSQGNSYWNPTTGQIYYRKSDGGDDGRALAGNFSNDYPGGEGRSVSSGVIGLSSDKIINTNGDVMSGSYANLNMRIYWDGDLLDEILNSTGGEGRPAAIFKWGGSRIWQSDGAVHNNSSKCNPSAQGDIIGDWREEVVLRTSDNSALRIFTTTTPTTYGIYSLWHDHQYRNAMAWQCVGYNQPPHTSFFLGELEGITMAPPPLILRGRTELQNGATIQTTTDHLLISGYEDKTFVVAGDASPYILTVNAPAWVKGTGAMQATASTPKAPARNVETFTTTLTGGAFSGPTRIVKQGEGILQLPNVVEKHTGNTDVWNGTLVFDGTMQSSPVWMNRHTTLISNGGQFLGGLKLDYNTTVYPGGKNNVGSITATELTLGFGSRIVFDAAAGGAVDKINANKLTIDVRNWEFGPKYKTPVFEFVNADVLTSGKYSIGTVGNISGKLSDVLVEGISNYRFYLSHEEGEIYLNVETLRDPSTVVWNGTSSSNVWDLAETYNFLNDGQADYAAVGDDIIFDDNAAYTTVTVKGAVSPKSITFNNDTKYYTLQGDSILGGGSLTKNGKGKVTITNENRIGNTVINSGTLSVNALANSTGITYGALGDVTKTITINDGATLNVTQPIITDQQLNVNGTVTVDVPTNIAFTTNKGMKGSGAVVNKTGAGTLTTGVGGNYKKLVVKAGRVNFIQSSNIDQAPDTVEFQNGIVWGANLEDGSGVTNRANFIVPAGKTGTFYGSFRGTYSGKLLGSGTFNVYTGGVRSYWQGDWSQFTGTVKVGKENRQNKKSYQPQFDFQNGYGLPNAILNVATGVICNNGGHDFSLGKLSGSGTLAGTGNWIIGENDADFYLTTEVGITSDRTDDYGGTISKSATKLIKRGAGKMTLMTLGKINATLTIEEGTMTFNNSALNVAVAGTNTTTVKEKGRIVGQGLFNVLAMESGAELIPCGSYVNETTPGIIKTSAMLRVNDGAVVKFLIGANSNSQLQPRLFTMNGTVKVELLSGYTPKNGDAFTLWTVTNTMSGTPKFDLPLLPEGLYWDVSELKGTNGVLRITNENTGIGAIESTAIVDCEVFALDGTKMASFTAPKGEVKRLLPAQLGMHAGTYIVRLRDGHRAEVNKVIVK